MALVRWPLGREGDRVLVVLGTDADLLVPLLDGEPEPEEGDFLRLIPAGIPDLEVPPDRLADELMSGPGDIWLVFPGDEAAHGLHQALGEALIEAGGTPASAAFLPQPLTLSSVLDALPAGRQAVAPGRPSRVRLLKEVLTSLWLRDLPDELVKLFILRQAAGG